MPGWGGLGLPGAVGVGQEVILQLRGQPGGMSGARTRCLASRTTGSRGEGANRGGKKAERSQVEADGQDMREALKAPVSTSPGCVLFSECGCTAHHVKHKGKDRKHSRVGAKRWVRIKHLISETPTAILAPRWCPPTG